MGFEESFSKEVHSKPSNITEYIKWLKDGLNVEVNDRTRNRYFANSNKILGDFSSSPFWTNLDKKKNDIEGEYSLSTSDYKLFAPNYEPKLEVKPYESFLLKTFRKNVITNDNWPSEPPGGWYDPNSCYSRIGDIVRTLFIVKYLDGVDFLAEKIVEICKTEGLDCKRSYEAKDEGYYAVHIDIKDSFEITSEKWDTDTIDMYIEIQITTQLQEVIRKLLHKYYEEKRQNSFIECKKWEWDYKSDEFSVNYLGHVLHYLEGTIVEIRDKQMTKKRE